MLIILSQEYCPFCSSQKLPLLKIFHSNDAGYWLKFSTSKNRISLNVTDNDIAPAKNEISSPNFVYIAITVDTYSYYQKAYDYQVM